MKINIIAILLLIVLLSSCYTVNFNVNGGSHIDAITNVQKDTFISKPEDPTKNRYKFGGWFKEADFTTLWDFNTDKVTSSITLYAKWDELEVGDLGPAGGIIFYDDEIGFDFDTNGVIEGDEKNLLEDRFLEAAPENWALTIDVGNGQEWGFSNSNSDLPDIDQMDIATIKETVGTGKNNTSIIIRNIPENLQIAASLCSAYEDGVYNDWFLPSAGELKILHRRQNLVRNFHDRFYWTSNEASNSSSWIINLGSNSGIPAKTRKDTFLSTFPIRSF